MNQRCELLTSAYNIIVPYIEAQLSLHIYIYIYNIYMTVIYIYILEHEREYQTEGTTPDTLQMAKSI